MLNMTKLDWLGMKVYQKRFIVIPLVTLFYGFFSAAILVPFMVFMMLSFSVNPFAVEEKGKLDNLYLTLPITRKSIVGARFGLAFIMQFIGLIVSIIATLIFADALYGETIFGTYTFQAEFGTMLLIICASLLFYAIMNISTFPVLFKMGYARGRALGFYIPIGVVTALIVAAYFLWFFNASFQAWLLSFVNWLLINNVLTAIVMLGLAALILALSYALSEKLYAKREF